MTAYNMRIGEYLQRITNGSAQTAWAAATSQAGQLATLAANWSGNVEIRGYSLGGTLLTTLTYSGWNTDMSEATYFLLLDTLINENLAVNEIVRYCKAFIPGGVEVLAWDISPINSSELSKVAVSGLRVNATASLPADDLQAWVSAPTVGQWAEVSGTNLSTAGVRQAQFGTDPGAVTGWGGWARNGSTLYLSGGGHSDGADNSVYSINLSADSPAWSRVADGSESTDWIEYHTVSAALRYAQYNLDDRPVAAHLYHYLQYAGGSIVRYGYYQNFGATLGTAMAINPNGEVWTNILNPATGSWSLGSITPSWIGSDDGSGSPASYNLSVSDGSLVYAVWLNRNYSGDTTYRLMSYNPATDTYTVIGSDLGSISPEQGGCLYDTSRGEMVQIPESGVLNRFNLSTGSKTTATLTGAASGFRSGWSSTYMGSCYDSTRDLYYVYAGQSGTGKTLYQIDPANSYVTTEVSTTGTPTTVAPCGVNSRMAYLADSDVIVMQPTYNSGLWALRLS